MSESVWLLNLRNKKKRKIISVWKGMNIDSKILGEQLPQSDSLTELLKLFTESSNIQNY